MRILKIESSNFGCFLGDQEIDMSDKEIIGLIGRWDENALQSNQAGKSTFIETILYAFYGESRADKEIDLIHHDAESDMYVKLTLKSPDDKVYTIKRGRTLSNNSIIEITGFEGSKKADAQAKINSILGLDSKEFLLMNYFQQSDINAFMDLGPTEQKKMLMKWQNNNIQWNDFESKSKSIVSAIKTKLEIIEKFFTDNREAYEDQDSIDENIETLTENITVTKENIAEYEKRVNKLKSKLADTEGLDDLVSQRKSLGKLLKSLQSNLNATIDSTKEAKKTIERHRSLQNTIKQLTKDLKGADGFDSKIKNLSVDIKNYESQLNNCETKLKSNKEIIKNVKNFKGTCPITKQACSKIAKDVDIEQKEMEIQLIDSEIEYFTEKIEELTEQHEELTKERLVISRNQIKLKNAEDEFMNIDSKEGLMKTIDNLEKYKKDIENQIKNAESKIMELDTQIEEAEKAADLIETIKEKIKKLNSLKKSEEDELEEFNKMLGGYQKEKENLAQLIEVWDQYVEDQDYLKMDLYEWQYVTYMYSKNGIPSYMIESLFDEIEGDINYILNKLNTKMSIEISSERELGQLEDKCSICGFVYPKNYRKKECESCGSERPKKKKDELQLLVRNNGNIEKFNQVSGGGKTLLSLAIRLAIIKMKRRQSAYNIGILFLDEIFAPLDKVNRNEVMRLIIEILQKDFEFEQIIIISHNSEIMGAIPDIIEVRKYDKYSLYDFI